MKVSKPTRIPTTAWKRRYTDAGNNKFLYGQKSHRHVKAHMINSWCMCEKDTTQKIKHTYTSEITKIDFTRKTIIKFQY